MSNDGQVEIYTDGACSGNPGPGGWAAILQYKDKEKIISGAEKNTTNNRMELTAALKALQVLKKPCKVNLYSDSAYLINAFVKGWLQKWIINGWKTANKSEVQNIDLWSALIEAAKNHEIQWIKVKGHADNRQNNQCDIIAVEEIKKMTKKADPEV